MKRLARLLISCGGIFLLTCARGEVEFLVLDSGRPGPVALIHAPEEGAGSHVLRQLRCDPPERGRLVLARPHDRGEVGWEKAPGIAALKERFGDARVLVFRKDEDTHAYDPQFRGDTVQGGGEEAVAMLNALRSMTGVKGKDWRALPAESGARETVVTTNARIEMGAGLRPALQERELRAAAHTFLRHLDMTDELAGGLRIFPDEKEGQIRVAVFDDMGAQNSIGREPAWLRSRLSKDAALRVELVGVPEILQGALDHADVLVMGGGKASLESQALGKEGRALVVDFVRQGGGYVGICAGAFLGSTSTGKFEYLGLLPVTTGGTALECVTPLKWRAGALGEAERVEKADLHGGPTFRIMEKGAGKIDVWASFTRNETHAERGEYKLEGTPAVISGLHGEGRVVLTSTHCERSPSPSTHFTGMVRWAGEQAAVPVE
ncbi:BPL-N domain-containing protein [Luteolibacter flavescens]|uniref:BPL-N domain-containing protein n=1 Tax=Luteolibacter flavescens TaxID=1859460 RepID=A0ABT3FPM0_9BACT|nr:BPL-N domain-containing protein [Luteolibacter flavescens]MCW1885397.1 BPL-N domain-containing protein [Luteolibacter flavescens]